MYLLLFPFSMKGNESLIKHTDTSNFYNQVFRFSKLAISVKAVKWDSIDYENLISSIHNSEDSTLIYFDSLMNYVKIIINCNQNNELQTSKSLIWKKSELPKRIKILSQESYEKRAKKKFIKRAGNITGTCSISKPIFCSEGCTAIIKVDYSDLKMNSNTCKITYFIFRLNNKVWETTRILGYNCTFE